MNLFHNTLHIFHPDMEEIRGRLSLCQTYSSTLNAPQIQRLKTKSHSPLFLFRLLPTLLGKKDIVVDFYCHGKKDHVSVYSDFFDFEGAFDMGKSFFEDMDTLVMAVSYAECQCTVHFIRGDTKIGSISLDLGHTPFDNVQLRIRKYAQQQLTSQDLVHINAICSIIQALHSMQALSEQESLQLLKDHCQIDSFIL